MLAAETVLNELKLLENVHNSHLSITNGHETIADAMNIESKLTHYLERLLAVDFVKDVRISPASKTGRHEVDAVLNIRTPRGTFAFAVEQKNSYIDHSLLNALISLANSNADTLGKPLLLFARYVPRPSAEKLIDSGVNFLDQAGNMHLALGANYARTIVGNRERSTARDTKAITAARVQLLFALAAYSDAPHWTVRQLAEATGLSKSNVAKVRNQLVDEGFLKKTNRTFAISDRKDIEPALLRGYEQVLRPKLFIGRYRAPESSNRSILRKLKEGFARICVNWSMTGGPAAYELQHFYRGAEVPIFVNHPPESATRELRLLPDRTGSVILLRSFGALPFWKKVRGNTVAHPWLIYAELMCSSDPRAHEAAQELKAGYLKND